MPGGCKIGVVWLLAMLSASALSGQDAGEYHVFTNKEGQKIEAKVREVSLETGVVTIIRHDGRTFELAGNLFSLNDQAFLRDWYNKQHGPPQGRLRFMGNPDGNREIDVSALEGRSDLVEVHALKAGWIAKSAGGRFHFFSDRDLPELSRVSANTVWFMAVGKDGTVWTSGRNQILPDSLTDIVDVSAGSGHSIALRKNGTCVVWGKRYGEDRYELHDPPVEMRGIVRVASSQHHVAAVNRDGEVFFWKSGESEVVRRSFNEEILEIQGSIFDFVLLTKSGEVYQFGSAGPDTANVPSVLDSEGPFQKVRCNGSTRAARKEDGSWIAWGKNASGIVDHINELGPVIDLDFISEPGERDNGYVVWIESEATEQAGGE